MLPKIIINQEIKIKKHHDLTNTACVVLNDGSKEEIYYKDLKYVQRLGSGCFGIVNKMIHVPTRLEFAVKVNI